MPSTIISNQKWVKKGQWSILTLLCSSLLVACGSGSSGTTRVQPDDTPSTPSRPVQTFSITATMPMHIVNAKLTIRFPKESKPVYENNQFTGFEVTVDELNSTLYRDQAFVVTLSGDKNTTMYDPILNKYVPFNGTMHAIAMVNSSTHKIVLTPFSEAVYQRSITRSDQFNYSNPDLSLITRRQLIKATTEVQNSFVVGFNTTEFPHFSNLQSISLLRYAEVNPRVYTNVLVGLGYLHYWATQYPTTENTYLELATNIGVDLRDGYLNGRSIVGDNTAFKTITPSPINYSPLNNTLLKIGELQKESRETFGEALKASTLYYAKNLAYQSVFNMEGLKALELLSYYTAQYDRDSSSNLRWLGAGDYRPAFGLTNTETCSNGLNPCRQGLNVDDIETRVNDVEYLIGTHQLNQCTIKFFPSGDVSITKGDKIYRNSINRDLADNLLQLNNDPQHYILNVGASENKPAYFLQFEIKDHQVIKAKSGHSDNIYPTALESTEMDCAT